MGLLDELKEKAKENGFDESMKDLAKSSGLDLNDDQLNALAEGLMNCSTDEELMKLIDGYGYELSEEQLKALSGGNCSHCYAASAPDCIPYWPML
ncbi:MAG: Nif11-like leader peptide family natural product precursor [Lachnospiraceae bacterium]|nr:Nif11-like leader peptide family natural product precursor [Lachnospiraceae bacterium]